MSYGFGTKLLTLLAEFNQQSWQFPICSYNWESLSFIKVVHVEILTILNVVNTALVSALKVVNKFTAGQRLILSS